jgi:micrococcal nuclease
MKPYFYKAKIISVYDGDTVTAVIDLGFEITKKIKIRLYGINAPEIRKANTVVILE